MSQRKSGALWWKFGMVFLAGTTLGAVAMVQVIPANQAQTVATVGQGSAIGNGPINNSGGAANNGVAGSTVPGQVGTLTGPPPGVECSPGKNGGVTDKGVTATSINLATTVVRSGPGAAFLADVQTAMEAVTNKVNHAGGICGRRLNVVYRDDGWSPTLGSKFLRNFIQAGFFAIAVGPSSEGLNVESTNHDIRNAGIPVVGTDGMLISQYLDPWIWPVAVSTASSARLMVLRAVKLGVKDFSIVFDKNYKFGVEAAEAFNAEVVRQTGHPVDGYTAQHNCSQKFCGIEANQPTYTTELHRFTGGAPKSLVAMFLEPATALTWMASPDAPKPNGNDPPYVWGGQPLFTRDFAVSCQGACDGMMLWTGYKPPIEDYQYDPKVRTYFSDMRATNPQSDPYNQFAEGGYVGMELLVKALKTVGPYLTRPRLKAVLDSMSLETGLTLDDKLGWRSGNHYSAKCMQGFSINYKGTFGGWRTDDIACDKHPEYGTH